MSESTAAEAHSSSLTQTFKDLFAGAVGGAAQVLIGQPFDIVKVRLQTTQTYTSALDAAQKIYAHEGPLAFYKGTLTPLIGIGACVSVQFGAFHEARRRLEALNLSRGHAQGLTYPQYYLAGASAGIANTVLSSPIEHVRIRLQTQPHGNARLYEGPLSCIKTLLKHNALYRGTGVTLLREAQAYGVWFCSFEYLMSHALMKHERKDIPSWKIALYGGLAGEALWLGSYPFDVVKSRLQSDGLHPALAGGGKSEIGAAVERFGKMKYPNARECAMEIFRTEGAMGFWRGIGPTLLRAMPVSAGTFFTVEMTMRAIS